MTRQLNAAVYFSTLIQQVHPNAAYRDRATAMTTKASSPQTALSLNRQVYLALTALDVSKTDPATRYYVQRQLLEFQLAGVDKDEATRASRGHHKSKFPRNNFSALGFTTRGDYSIIGGFLCRL